MLGDIGVLKSMLSVEAVHVIVAITDNVARLRIANSIRGLGAQFFTAVHPAAYVSAEAVVGDGSVLAAGAVVHPGGRVGVRAVLGQNSSVGRKAVVKDNTEIAALSLVEEEGYAP